MKGGEITYDDTELQRLFSALSVKQREKVFKSAFSRQASKVRRIAVSALKSSGLHNVAALSKGIRTEVARKSVGFRVTAKPAKKKGYHRNRQGRLKPVLLWAELGTVDREKRKTGAATGHMKAYGFMAQAKASCGSVQEELRGQIERSIITTARRYGCN